MMSNDHGAGTRPLAFTLAVTEKIGFSVYLLIDPRDGWISDVGKATSGDYVLANAAWRVARGAIF